MFLIALGHLDHLVLDYLLYFSLGAFLSLNKINLTFLDSKKNYCVFALWMLLLAIKTYPAIMNNDTNVVLHRIALIIGVVAIWLNYNMIEKLCGRFLLWFSKYTFMVYLFHMPFIRVLREVFEKLNMRSNFFVLPGYFFCVVVAIAGCILLSVCMKSITPRFYRIINGGR